MGLDTRCVLPKRRASVAGAPRVIGMGQDGTLSALAKHGLDLRCVLDGRAAIDAFLSEGACAVILDTTLPGEDAHATCRAIKTFAGEDYVPVIFLTSSSDMDERVRLLEEGDEVCPVGVSLDELGARLRALLRIRERQRAIESDSRRLRLLALMDPLTGLGNRRAFDRDLEREWARVTRSGTPLALLVVDIDAFKTFNDLLGHATGDLVLRGVGTAIEDATRRSDRAFRWGGDEFAVLLTETTHETACLVAERIRGVVAAQGMGSLAVTVSIGVSSAPHEKIGTREALVEIADRALRDAKIRGRNRVAS